MSKFVNGILSAQLEVKKKVLQGQNDDISRLMRGMDETKQQIKELEIAIASLAPKP